MQSGMKPPVFVLGCPRSGTTFLYHMLLSSGGFAVYRTESHVFDMILPRFGNLRSPESRKQLMEYWLNSHYFRLSGLDPETISERVLTDCKGGGDFLKIVMGSIAENQKVDRWAETTPAHLLYMSEIKKALPDALFIHVIRDGRDVALSMERQKWISPFSWDKERSLLVTGLYWDWIVRRGRELGRKLAPDYLEVHFEDLVADPRESLKKIGDFIDHDLDYDRVREVGIGSVSKPNTSFESQTSSGAFNPVGRWKENFSASDLAMFEALVGESLRELGYAVESSNELEVNRARLEIMRLLYPLYFDSKQWVKAHTPLSRLMVSLDLMHYGPQYARR